MAEKTSEFKFYVIGAGLPRTGTFTMKKALEILYPGKCMHMISIYQEDYYTPLMDYVFNDNSSDEEFKSYFEKYNIVAGVDAPFISVYKRAMKVFPDAKVVLTVRDPESWVNSMQRTVCVAQRNGGRYRFPLSIVIAFTPSFNRFREFLKEEPILDGAINSVLDGKGVEFYESWIANVKETVESERLLIYNVKEGWEPLCRFLNVSVPNQPFPQSNNPNEFYHIIRKLEIIAWTKLLILIGIPIAFGVAYYRSKDVSFISNIKRVKDFLIPT